MTKASKFDMVESTQPEAERGKDSERPRELRGLAIQSLVVREDEIESALVKLEMAQEWNQLTDKEKVREVIQRAESKIVMWYNMEQKKLGETYDEFKSKVVSFFAGKGTTWDSVFKLYQRSEEPVREFCRRVETAGNKLNLQPQVKMQIIKQGIRKNKERMIDLLIGKEVLTAEVLAMLEEAETVYTERERRSERLKTTRSQLLTKPNDNSSMKCFRCGQLGHRKFECKTKLEYVNEVQLLNSVGKSSEYCVNGRRTEVLLDSGADGNFMSYPLAQVLRVQLERLKEPVTGYTCLGQRFRMWHRATVKISVKKKRFTVEVLLLPQRQEEIVILGKRWLQENEEHWREQIHRFNIKVEHRKDETIPHVDALSRQTHQGPGEERKEVNEIAADSEISKMIQKRHSDLIHRGAVAVKKSFEAEGVSLSEKVIRDVLQDRKVCKQYNPVRMKRYKQVEAYEMGERVAFDIGMTPNQAMNQQNWEPAKRNLFNYKLKQNYRVGAGEPWRKYTVGDEVLVRPKE